MPLASDIVEAPAAPDLDEDDEDVDGRGGKELQSFRARPGVRTLEMGLLMQGRGKS